MKNFTLRPDGDYRFRNKDQGEVVTIQVEYDKGGAMLFSHHSKARGVYITGRFSTIGEGFESFSIGGGRKGFCVLVERGTRKTPKRIQHFANLLDEHVARIAATLDTEGQEAAMVLVGSLCKQEVAA
jgi:hypothetical protein